MKYEIWTKAMEEISDRHIVEAAKIQKKRRRPLWLGLTAAAAVAAIVLGVVLWPGGSPLVPTVQAVSQAEYPASAPYPDESSDAAGASYEAWYQDQAARREWSKQCNQTLGSFLSSTIPQFLAGQTEENRVYSPLSLYMALAMLAELTDGNSRQQVLDLLDVPDLETLRTRATALWQSHYVNDGATTCILASSLWLDQDVTFVQSTLDTLSKTYYASTYQGKMGSKETNQALRSWINEQTGGLLQEQAEGLELSAETVLALVTTVYFRAKWASEFSPSATEPGLFHGLSQDITCDFMKSSSTQRYCRGEAFSAVYQPLEGGGGMWLLLPDAGSTPEDLLSSGEAVRFLLTQDTWEDSQYLTVHLRMPKFDVASDLDLSQGLQSLGVTDVFDSHVSDFTPTTTQTEELYISQANHAARVMVDEEGCTAASYTVLAVEGAGMPPEEEVDFTLDRPFLFVITGEDGLPLFVGTVYEP